LGGPKAEAERERGLGRKAEARPNLWHFVSPEDQAQRAGGIIATNPGLSATGGRRCLA
jgi:hypothetical protein